MRNITKIYFALAILLISFSPVPSQGHEAVDDTFDNGILDESYSIKVSKGQVLHIEITSSVGNISFFITDQLRGVKLKLTFSGDTDYRIVMDRAVNLRIFIASTPNFRGHVRIYSDGISSSSIYQAVWGISLFSFGIIAELILRRSTTSPYLHDEDTRISIRGMVIGIVPVYFLNGLPRMSSVMFRSYGNQFEFAPDLLFYDLYTNGKTSVFLMLIILLIVLTHHLSTKHGRPSPYSVYPIDARQQYRARVIVYLSVLFAPLAFSYGFGLFNGEYSGSQYIWLYLTAFASIFMTLSLFVLVQILLTDFLRNSWVTPYLLPSSILIYALMFQRLNLPLYHLLVTNMKPFDDSPFPYLWYIFMEVIVGIAATVYLNLRLRKSNTFVAN